VTGTGANGVLADALCPVGEYRLGGSGTVSTSDGLALTDVQSEPITSGDQEGWQVGGASTSGFSDVQSQAWAICSK
jgi:hypothetical protein